MTEQTAGLRAEVVGLNDDLYVLVRGITADTTDADLLDAAKVAYELATGCSSEPYHRWEARPCRLYRWVPAPPDAEYTRYLWPAKRPGPGAFWAVEVHPQRVVHSDRQASS